MTHGLRHGLQIFCRSAAHRVCCRRKPQNHDKNKEYPSEKVAKKTDSTKAGSPSGFWLVKQEPEGYSWDDFVRDGRTEWTGVRTFQARNNLRQMKAGDRVLFYHTGTGKCVVGIAEVSKAPYPDPTADDPQWVAVDIKPV